MVALSPGVAFEDSAVVAELFGSAAAAVRPDPRLTISEWADEHRELTRRESPEPGPWRTDRTPYLREIMDCLSPSSPVERVVFMASSQVGKTEVGNNWCGFAIHHSPAPMLVVQPTQNAAKKWSRQRLSPMIEASPALQERVGPPRARDSGNTLLSKEFPGGIIMIGWAGSAAELASMPIMYLMADEVDRWDLDVDEEGDPLALAEQRTANFRRRKILVTSTPTVEGISRIDTEYEESDQRKFFVPCPDCGHRQVLRWAQVHWQGKDPDTAAYSCESCGSAWDDVARWRAVSGGEWRATKPFTGTAGFWIWAAYSPWVRLRTLVKKFLKAKRTHNLQPFFNLQLGEVFRPGASAVDPTGLMKRREPYPANPVPAGVVLITMGVDTQDDRLEGETLGWGRDGECWSLDYFVLQGDTTTPAVWEDLDRKRAQVFEHPYGVKLRVAAVAIDTQGHSTQTVYRYCKGRFDERVYAIRGVGGAGKPIVGKPSTNNRQRTILYPVGVDPVKGMVMKRLRIAHPDGKPPAEWEEGERVPGFCHFPERYEKGYFEGLTAEKAVPKESKGRQRIEWRKPTGARNEPFDCRVYNHAALELLGVDLNSLADGLERHRRGEPPARKRRGRRVRSRGVAA